MDGLNAEISAGTHGSGTLNGSSGLRRSPRCAHLRSSSLCPIVLFVLLGFLGIDIHSHLIQSNLAEMTAVSDDQPQPYGNNPIPNTAPEQTSRVKLMKKAISVCPSAYFPSSLIRSYSIMAHVARFYFSNYGTVTELI